MRRWHKVLPVVLMGASAIAYVLLRPALLTSVPYLAIMEFPVGALIIALVLWRALARRRAVPAPLWRRHEQVVRVLPDPALTPYLGAIERWLETGEGREEAANALALAATPDEAERDRLRAELAEQMQVKASRRKRESLLKERFEGV